MIPHYILLAVIANPYCKRLRFVSVFVSNFEEPSLCYKPKRDTKVSTTLELHSSFRFTGKAYDITYVRIVFYSPRPQSFAVYKKTGEERDWESFQYFRYNYNYVYFA